MDEKYILDQYFNKNRSLPEIAEELKTYPNKIKRMILKTGRQLRNKSEAQKIALKNGRTEHPTQGKHHSEETREKISNGSAKNWKNMSKAKKQSVKENMAKAWEKRDPELIESMQRKSAQAVAKAGREGSKLEKFLLEKLTRLGYNVLAHKKGLVSNSKLEPDLLLPDIKIVIEIDGPTHFFPIFGEKSLQRTIKADTEKNGLFIQEGYCVVRVKHICNTLTQYKKREALKNIVATIEKIKKKHDNNIIEIEV